MNLPSYVFNVHKISRQLNFAMAFYNDLLAYKNEEKSNPPKQRNRVKKLSLTLRIHISPTHKVILLKFDMWDAKSEGHLQAGWLSWLHDTLLCVLIKIIEVLLYYETHDKIGQQLKLCVLTFISWQSRIQLYIEPRRA